MHHYNADVARTIAPRGPVRQMWQTAIPELGFDNPFLLELLLAFSAVHLMRHGADVARYSALANQHEAAGLKSLTAAIGNLETSNATAVYVSTTLSCYIHLGKGPTQGDCLVFSKDGIAPWFTMFRGIRSVSEMRPKEDFGAVMALMKPREDDQDDEMGQPEDLTKQKDICMWSSHLQRVEQHAIAHQGSVTSITRALATLQDTFLKTFGSEQQAPLPRDETGHLPFAWLYMLPDDFVKLAQSHDPVALILLTYFAVLVKHLEAQWWLRGWAENIVLSARELLAAEWQDLTDWPLQQVLDSDTDMK